MPRGLDLLPSMRAPRRVPPIAMVNGGSSSCGNDGDNRDGAKGSGGKKTAVAGAVEYVPWIGGSASLGGVRPGEKGVGTAAPAPVAPAANGIEDRVRWFPRGLPMEPTAAGEKGQDERDSAMFNTRASMAIDRLGEQVGETAKRQAEMETRRREKVRYERRQTRDAGLVWYGVVGVAESTLPPWQNASPRIPSGGCRCPLLVFSVRLWPNAPYPLGRTHPLHGVFSFVFFGCQGLRIRRGGQKGWMSMVQ